MPIYQFVDVNNQLQTIEAATPSEAIAKAPNRKSDSGVSLVATPQPQRETAGTTSPTVPESDPVGRITNLSLAMNKALSVAREQRQDSTLDMLGGVIPSGSVPASSFTSVLSSLQRASAPLEATLAGGAIDFARDQEAQVQNQKNNIRDLALTLAQEGVGQETISALLEAPDIDTAITQAASALEGTSKETIQQVGSNLVAYDKDGNVRVLFSAGGGGDGGTQPQAVPFDEWKFSDEARQILNAELDRRRADTGTASLTTSTAEQFLRGEYEERFGVAPEPETATQLTNLTPSNERDLEAARLSNANGSVQSFFLNTPSAFRQEFSRKVVTGQIDPSSLTIEKLAAEYDRWVSEQNTTEGDRILDDFLKPD